MSGSEKSTKSIQPLPPSSSHRWKNPIRLYAAYRKKKRLEKEKELLLREERMNEDLERYLMEIEEHRCWVTFQLGHVNYERMKKKEVLLHLTRKEDNRQKALEEEWGRENGLSYYLGNIENNRRWQNSPAKYLDYIGHQGAVTACRLSPCSHYLLSCSEDRTLRIWNIDSSECLKTLIGHNKVVNDGDFHMDFKMFQRHPSIVSGSGDGTLKIWNGSDCVPLTTLYGHENAVYKVSFAPDGKTIVSCSEDRTIRTWCFPEGYNLFVYRGHASGVLSVRFSCSGRFLASGSDYGERKILLWNSKLPAFNEPSQFPHIFFWTPEGLIKKIVIRKTTPRPNFWLKQNELHYINDDELDIWPGEISDVEDEKEGEEEEGEEEKEENDLIDGEADLAAMLEGARPRTAGEAIFIDDRKEMKGVSMRVIRVGTSGDQSEAVEYNPGGFLVVSLKSPERPIAEAFFHAMSKSARQDIFLPTSGLLLGKFQLDAPVPWLPVIKEVDAKGRIKHHREVHPGMIQSKDGLSAIFRETMAKIPVKMIKDESRIEEEGKETKGQDIDPDNVIDREQMENDIEEELAHLKKMDVVWTCPTDENLGVAIIVVNVRLRDSTEWLQLRCSLKESHIRVNAAGELKVKEIGSKRPMMFDQEERHRLFWKHIRQKDYRSAATFIDRRAIVHTATGSIYRRFRVMNLMSTFEEAKESDSLEGTDSLDIPQQPSSSSQVNGNEPLLDTIDEGDDGVLEEYENGLEGENEGVDGDIPYIEGETHDGNGEEADQIEDLPENIPLHDEPVAKEQLGDMDSLSSSITTTNRIQSSEAAPLHSLLFNVTSRPTTKAQVLQAWRQRAFHHEVLRRTEELTEEVIVAEKEGLACAHEKGLRKPNARFISILHKRLQDIIKKSSVEQSHNADNDSLTFMNLIDQYDLANYLERDLVEELYEVQKKSVYGENAHRPPGPPATMQLLTSDMLKTGKYGPDIEAYSMPLPQFFPQNAGKAQYALAPAVSRYERVVTKFAKEQLPTTLEEVYVPTLRDRAVELYHRINKTDELAYRKRLQSILQVDIERQMVEESVYIGRRRQTFLSLPGLQPHYPNPNYPQPAIILPEADFPPPTETKVSFMDKLFGRKVVRSTNYPPVGRKPAHIAGLSYAQWMVKMAKQAEEAAQDLHSMLYFDRVEFEDDILGNLKENEESIAKKKKKKGLFNKEKKTKKHHRKYKPLPTVRDVLKEGYPPAFNPGRRGSYPLAPGLMDFLEMQKTDAQVFIDSLNLSESDIDGVPGLVRRFTIHGFELAHHGAVNDLTFAPSEARLVTAGGDGLIKVWDPRDGSFVRSLRGHKGEVRSVAYTSNEQFLVSCGDDSSIIIWSLLTQTIQRVLRGHVDVVHSVSISPDCSIILSASHDMCLKSWYTTPRAPAVPQPPRVLRVTHCTAMLTWSAPPAFNLDLTAFHIQYRVGVRGRWRPRVSTNLQLPGPEVVDGVEVLEKEEILEEKLSLVVKTKANITVGVEDGQERAGLCVGPHLRTMTILHLIPATYYQFRIRAENRLGLSDWSQPSPLTRTEFGLPEAPEFPLVVRVGKEYIEVLWFTANPETFGSASTSFHLQCQGKDFKFESDPDPVSSSKNSGKSNKSNKSIKEELGENTLEVTLEEACKNGRNVLTAFQHIHDRYLRTKDKLRKSEVFSTYTRQSIEEEEDFPVFHELPSETIFQVIDKSEDKTHLAVSAIFPNLRPGFLYSFRVRGVNRVGKGKWSPPTLTATTLPDLPSPPSKPTLQQSTLRSLTFQWNPPKEDGGTAVTGYTVHLMNKDKYIDVSRSTVTYTWQGLFPGRLYRYRVRAINSVGPSEYSEPNDAEDGYTSTAPPEQPIPAPLAISGSWNELIYQVQTPYHNGAPVDYLVVQYRSITPFLVGSWEVAPGLTRYPVRQLLYPVSVGNDKIRSRVTQEKEDLVEMIRFVDTVEQQQTLEATVAELELMKSTAGFNPHKADKSKLDEEIEDLIHRQKPGGSVLAFHLQGLAPDSMYEVRVAFANKAGQGNFSDSSHRAKTNKASPPAACQVPTIISLGTTFMVLEVTVPNEGGATVRFFQIEYIDLDDSNTVKLRLSRNALDQDATVQYRLDHLRAGGSYLVRCCAESSIGPGPFSPWTKEVDLPAPIARQF
eukprot:scaffold1034_cov175-Ochromonas_danica.AAC.19